MKSSCHNTRPGDPVEPPGVDAVVDVVVDVVVGLVVEVEVGSVVDDAVRPEVGFGPGAAIEVGSVIVAVVGVARRCVDVLDDGRAEDGVTPVAASPIVVEEVAVADSGRVRPLAAGLVGGRALELGRLVVADEADAVGPVVLATPGLATAEDPACRFGVAAVRMVGPTVGPVEDGLADEVGLAVGNGVADEDVSAGEIGLADEDGFEGAEDVFEDNEGVAAATADEVAVGGALVDAPARSPPSGPAAGTSIEERRAFGSLTTSGSSGPPATTLAASPPDGGPWALWSAPSTTTTTVVETVNAATAAASAA